jgi:hypothetical protein
MLGQYFIDEWNLLKAVGNSYPPELINTNSKLKTFNVDGGTIVQWFAPTSGGPDLDYARELIKGAEQGILFLFFNPGVFEPDDKPERWTLLQTILVRHQEGTENYSPALYIHGVVNQEIAGLTNEDAAKPSKRVALDPATPAPVKLYGSGKRAPWPVPYDSMVPKAIKDKYHDFTSEVMNQGVHVHSKVVVIDPFGKKPVVMTGSHNMGHKASSANDDDLMIVEGNAPLAAAYAANIIAIYQHYRWNTYVDGHVRDPHGWHGPVDNATWQNRYLAEGPQLVEIKFWLGEGPSAPAAAAQPVPAPPAGGVKVRAATATGSAPAKGKSKKKSAKSVSKQQARRKKKPGSGTSRRHAIAPKKRSKRG